MIGLDEGQFFTDVVEFAENLANIGKTVVIAALDGTYQRQKFNRILELVPLSEHVVKLNAVCMMCAGDAAFTKRIKSNDDRLEVIGGAETYMATCRECHNEKGISASDRLKLNDNNSDWKNLEIEREPLKAVPLNANLANISSTKENIPA